MTGNDLRLIELIACAREIQEQGGEDAFLAELDLWTRREATSSAFVFDLDTDVKLSQLAETWPRWFIAIEIRDAIATGPRKVRTVCTDESPEFTCAIAWETDDADTAARDRLIARLRDAIRDELRHPEAKSVELVRSAFAIICRMDADEADAANAADFIAFTVL